jgi:hypothetical protein
VIKPSLSFFLSRPENKRSIFFNLLRPEFVARAGQVPLCADAFSGWCSLDPRFKEARDECHSTRMID